MILNRFLILFIVLYAQWLNAHPLRLSLCEIDYTRENESLTISLKLFLTDVNEALVFDPSNELAFCQANESSNANQMLLDYLNDFFHLKINGIILPLEIKEKNLVVKVKTPLYGSTLNTMGYSLFMSLKLRMLSLQIFFLTKTISFIFIMVKKSKALC